VSRLSSRFIAVTIALIAIALLVSSSSRAAGASGQELWRFRNFTTHDGLAHDIVRDVVEDAEGKLYFATMEGITHYDPQRCAWKTLRPEGKSARLQVMDLALAPSGVLWVATLGGGVGRLENGRWRWYGRKNGLPSEEITALFLDHEGMPWAVPTGGGIAHMEGERWRVFGAADGLASHEVGRCIQTRDKTILCASYGAKLLQRFDGTRWSSWPLDIPGTQGFYVHGILEARDGKLWLATKGAGVIVGARTAEGAYSWKVHDTSTGLSGNRAGALFEARDGSVWVATSVGLSRFSKGRWRTFSRRDGLPSNHVFAIVQARDGALWFATLGGGVARYARSRWRQFGREQGLPSENLTGGLLVRKNGEVWVGTHKGIIVLGGPRPRLEQTGDAAQDSVQHIAQAGDDAVWVATRDGLRRYDLQTRSWRHFPAKDGAGPVHAHVRWIAAHRKALYFATDGGVSRYAKGRWKSYTSAEGLPDDRVNAVMVAKGGVVWAATAGGLARLDGERWIAASVTRPGMGPHSETPSRMKRVYRLVEDDAGTLWASGLDGAYARAPGKAWRLVQPSRWLPAGVYSRFVVKTSEGALWFAVRGLGVRRFFKGRWSVFTSDSGLAADTIRDVARHPDGSLLFATLGGGLSRYTPDKAAPETFIGPGSGALVARTFVHGHGVVLTFSGEDVLKDTPTGSLQFSYRIDEKGWSPFEPRNRVRLSGLKPGRHRFAVRAMDRDLNVDASPAIHTFRVVRPWWREPWVFALLLFSLSALAYAGWRIVRAMRRERAALHREQVLVDEQQRFVRLASHELRKPLTRMAHRAEMLTMPEIQEQHEVVGRYAQGLQDESLNLARLVQTLLDQARVEQGIELKKEQLDLTALVWATAKEFEGSAGDLELSLPPGAVFVEADPVYMKIALCNLMDNAQKYGEPPVEVALTNDPLVGVRLLVSDHGEGIAEDQRDEVFAPFVRGRTSPEHGGFGLGLPFAREIARAHGGDLLLEGATGSRFILSFGPQAAKNEPVDKERG